MRDQIRNFVINSGYDVYEMIPILYGKADFVGLKDDECIVIESKVSKWKDALNQILRYGYGADRQYIAMPSRMANYVYENHLELLNKYEVGLLNVNKEGVNILTTYKKDFSHIYKTNIKNIIKNRKFKSQERIEFFKQRFSI